MNFVVNWKPPVYSGHPCITVDDVIMALSSKEKRVLGLWHMESLLYAGNGICVHLSLLFTPLS